MKYIQVDLLPPLYIQQTKININFNNQLRIFNITSYNLVNNINNIHKLNNIS